MTFAPRGRLLRRRDTPDRRRHLSFALLTASAVPAEDWALAVVAGVGTERNFSETVTRRVGDLTCDRVLAVMASRPFWALADGLELEGEMLYARHFGRQDYHEAGLGLYARWRRFPWNDVAPTSFAVGLGPSVTSVHPALERQDDPSRRSKLLNQVNLELTAAHPELDEAELVLRLQHRCGVCGLFGGVTDASNFLTLGLRRRF